MYEIETKTTIHLVNIDKKKLTMFHEHTKQNNIRKHLRTRRILTIVRHARIQLGHQKLSLTFMLITHNIPSEGQEIDCP